MNKVICHDPPEQERQIKVGDLIKIGAPFNSVYIAARVGINQLNLVGLDSGNRFNCDSFSDQGKNEHKVFVGALGNFPWSFVNSVTITTK